MAKNTEKWPTPFKITRITLPVPVEISGPSFAKCAISIQAETFLVQGIVNQVQLDSLKEWGKLDPQSVIPLDQDRFALANIIDKSSLEEFCEFWKSATLSGQYQALKAEIVKVCQVAFE